MEKVKEETVKEPTRESDTVEFLGIVAILALSVIIFTCLYLKFAGIV